MAAALTFRAEHVSKTFPTGVRANDDVSLSLEPGEVYALLGPAGAGKTTFLRQVVGLLRPTSGRLLLGAHDLVADPHAARQLCSYLPQGQIPVGSFRVREAIVLTGFIRGATRAEARRCADRLIESLDLTPWRNALVLKLPGGLQRLVGLAMAAVRPGRLVLLDEPMDGVEPAARGLLRAEIRGLAEAGSAVLLATRTAADAERTVDRLAVLDHGRIVGEGTPAALGAADLGRLRLTVTLAPGAAAPEPPDWAAHHTRLGQNLLSVLDEADADRAIAWCRASVEAGVAEEYALSAATLDDAYARLTAPAPPDAVPDVVGGIAS